MPERLAQTHVAGHFVMDRSAIVAALAASGFDGTFDHLSSGEEQRARTLVAYRDARLFRPHLVASTRTAARLAELDREAPNFAVVTRLVRRAAQVSLIAGAPIRLPPIVLLGSAGIGKSRYATLLAAALETSCHLVNGSTLPDVGSLTGYPPVWRGSGPGRLAKFLLSSPTSGPVIFIDEAEKIADFEAMTHPTDRLLPILERDTAAAFQDENLQVPMRAQHALFIFACNSLDTLSAPSQGSGPDRPHPRPRSDPPRCGARGHAGWSRPGSRPAGVAGQPRGPGAAPGDRHAAMPPGVRDRGRPRRRAGSALPDHDGPRGGRRDARSSGPLLTHGFRPAGRAAARLNAPPRHTGSPTLDTLRGPPRTAHTAVPAGPSVLMLTSDTTGT